MRSEDAAESGTALISSMIEPIALTKSSPDALGARRTTIGLRLLKPKRARAGKEDSPGSPLGPYVLVGFWHSPKGCLAVALALRARAILRHGSVLLMRC